MGRLKVLVCAYACEPNAGSEYGVGWNLPNKLSEKNDIYVLTRCRCRDKIEQELIIRPVPGLNFIFYDLPKWLYYKKEIGSNWGEQYNYLLWQLFSIWFVKRLQKKYHFDLIHHLTFNQYRTPSPGFFVNIPFVMGPVGGAETIAPCFYPDLMAHTARKEALRRKGKDFKFFRWLCGKTKNNKHILCSSQENLNRLSGFSGNSSISVLPAIGFEPEDFTSLRITKQKNGFSNFEMIYAGKAFDWKGIHIFLKAAKRAFIDNNIQDFKIKLIGIRFDDEQKMVMGWVKQLGLTDYVALIPFVKRDELLSMLTTCNLSVYPAFRDSGSMSVLEACVMACPSICFDAGGQDVFPDSILIKVPIEDTYEQNLLSFSEKLKWSYSHPEELAVIGQKSSVYVYENFSWDKKANELGKIYASLLAQV